MRARLGGLLRGLSVGLVGLMATLLAAPALARADADLVLAVQLDPHTRSLAARAQLRAPAGAFEFVLHAGLQPRSASVAGRSLPIRAAGRRGPDRVWRVVLPEPATLELDYAGTLAALERARDHRGVLQRMPPMSAPEGSFLSSGSAWYPQPAAMFSYRVEVSVPGDQRVIVPGQLAHERLPAVPGEPYVAHFVFAHPAEGIDLMAGPWTIRERALTQADGRPLRLRTYFPAALDAEAGLAEAYLADSQRYLERYSAQIGAYPFTEFAVVAGPLPTGFGMPTLTYIGEQVLRLPFIRATALGHEVLHNWWGNGVYVDYARGNWCEGLTTFMADYAYREESSDAAAMEMRLGWLRDFAAIAPGQEQALASFRARTHGAAAAVGYGKSAMVFVMLRDAIGAEAFTRGIRHFWATQRFRTASWDDLRASFELAAGRPLGDFFAQWLNVAGGARVRIERALWDEAEVPRLRLTLAQDGPVHALRLPVVLSAAARSETHWIEFDQARAQRELRPDFIPDTVQLDPEVRVWRLLEPAQLPPILRQWIGAQAPRWVLADDLPGAPAVASSPAGLATAAAELAVRLFERMPRRLDASAVPAGAEPVVVIGTHGAVDAWLARANLPPQPAQLRGRGSAQVWTLQSGSTTPLALIAARDAEALHALLRPLPHYGAQSWLAFDGARVLERGVWPVGSTRVAVERQRP